MHLMPVGYLVEVSPSDRLVSESMRLSTRGTKLKRAQDVSTPVLPFAFSATFEAATGDEHSTSQAEHKGRYSSILERDYPARIKPCVCNISSYRHYTNARTDGHELTTIYRGHRNAPTFLVIATRGPNGQPFGRHRRF
jgi:hypothetical protein